MIRRSVVIGIILCLFVLAVAGGFYAYSALKPIPSEVSVKDLMASPKQYDGSLIKISGRLEAVYNHKPHFFLYTADGDLALIFSEAVWGSSPKIGEYIGKQVEITGIFRTAGLAAQPELTVEVQTIGLAAQ